jgi:hypothetical protein
MSYRLPTLQTLGLTAIIATIAAALLAFSRPVEMIVDGEHVVSDVPPVTTANDVYVPLRSLADALGAETEVDRDRVTVVRGDQSLRLRIGNRHATIDGEPFTLKQAPFRVRGRLMISLHAVGRAFHVQATYDERTARIDIITPGIGEAPSGTVAVPHTQ